MTGTLAQTPTGWDLQFVRHLKHSPEKVWAALVDPEQRAAWFPGTMTGDLTPGATLHLATGIESLPEFTGTVIAVEPERVLEFTWGEDVLRFEIEPTAGGCTLTLRDSIAELGKAARDGAGWHVCLEQLDAVLAGRPTSDDTGQRWTQVHPDYVAAFGREAATIGPPPGWDKT
jgi:uncharacterized protein YndB with AHSA1/START domain